MQSIFKVQIRQRHIILAAYLRQWGRAIEYYDNGKIKSDAKWLLGKKLNEKNLL